MAQHILLAVDKSAFCEAAGEVAMQLAAAQPSRITALHIVNVRPRSGNILRDLGGWFGFEPAVVSRAVAKAREDEATALVMDWVEGARQRGLEADGRVEVGKVERTIEAIANEADLLVLGLRGEMEERFPGQGGAMWADLADRVTVPVLFTTPRSAPLTAVAVGYDGSEDAKHALSAVRRFIQPLKIPVHVIQVTDTDDHLLDEVDEQLPNADVHKHTVATGESHHGVLVDKARELGVQLLVLGFHGRNALKDFMVGTWTDQILMAGDLGVLVAH